MEKWSSDGSTQQNVKPKHKKIIKPTPTRILKNYIHVDWLISG